MMKALLPLLAMAIAGASSIEAQTASLERVDQLLRLGRADEARGVLIDWWEDGRGDASRRELQRGLWLRGRLTVDPVQAELDFQRLIVLYPRGQFTPDAILRLAQSAHEMGDDEGARRHVATLVRDYRNSEARAEAESWIRAAGPAPPPPTGVRTRPADEVAPGAIDPTRVSEEVRPPPPTEVEDAPEDAPGPQVGTYFVQLGAFAEEARAVALFEEVSEAGVDVRVVRVDGSRFFHVRFGRFVERADAVEELERLTEAGINAALVRDERAELPVGN